MYKFIFFVPAESAKDVMQACFNAGAGKIGNYDQCSFYSGGIGQFRPLEGSEPAIGEIGKLEKVKELKVEMVCADHRIREVVTAMKKSHPYETPAFEVYKLEEL